LDYKNLEKVVEYLINFTTVDENKFVQRNGNETEEEEEIIKGKKKIKKKGN
jgi:hypothetical protein